MNNDNNCPQIKMFFFYICEYMLYILHIITATTTSTYGPFWENV